MHYSRDCQKKSAKLKTLLCSCPFAVTVLKTEVMCKENVNLSKQIHFSHSYEGHSTAVTKNSGSSSSLNIFLGGGGRPHFIGTALMNFKEHTLLIA